MGGKIGQRKAHHLDLCGSDAVKFRQKTTLFEEVELLHNPFPELHVDDIDTSITVMGKKLNAPITIASMSGGTDEAVRFNEALARLAEKYQIAMGLGSMRPLLVKDGVAAGFLLRKQAPSILLLGNLGLVQARDLSTKTIESLIQRVGADALCLHLNPAQERIQPGGDRNFTGGLATLKRCVEELSVPVIAKETGCGISQIAAQKAKEQGVKWLDVSGAGGTSWVGVEALRAQGLQEQLGEQFWDWGIPTAASVVQSAPSGLGIFATGGIAHGLHVAKALALGATTAGLARPFLLAYNEGGSQGLEQFLVSLIEGLRTAMLLTGCKDIAALQKVPLALGPTLQAYVPHDSDLWSQVINVHRPRSTT